MVKGLQKRKGLLELAPRPNYPDSLIVAMDIIRDGEDSKIYRLFQGYSDFAIYQNNEYILKGRLRHFYEIIHNSYQKSHFDIDVSLGPKDSDIKETEITDPLIKAIISSFEEFLHISIRVDRDIILCVSHGTTKMIDDGNRKLSFHIVVDNYCHEDNIEAKKLYEKVREKCPLNIQKYIDSSVYKLNQEFRIQGSCKLKADNTSNFRFKNFCEEFIYQGERIIHKYDGEPRDQYQRLLLQLQASLVSFLLLTVN